MTKVQEIIPFILNSLRPHPPLPPSCLKAKLVPCSWREGTCAVRTETRRRGSEDDNVGSNPTSPQRTHTHTHTHTHTLYTYPHTLIKGILEHNREDGADLSNEQRNMAWRCVHMCLRVFHPDAAACMGVCVVSSALLVYACQRKDVRGSIAYCAGEQARTSLLYVHACIPLFPCSRVCAERPRLSSPCDVNTKRWKVIIWISEGESVGKAAHTALGQPGWC